MNNIQNHTKAPFCKLVCFPMKSVYNQFSLLHFYWLSFGAKKIVFFVSLCKLLAPHLMVRFRGGNLCLPFYKNYIFSQQ